MVKNSIEIAPSILAGDHAALADSVKKISDANLKWVHVDIMDGHFVPNLTFGPQLVADLKKHFPKMFYDVHLMLDNPHLYVEPFAKAGANLISIHVEPDYPIDATLEQIHLLGCQGGITINPKTDVSCAYEYLPRVDLVLIMSVQPGFGGQKFQESAIAKVEQLAKWRKELGLNFRIEVDGGVNDSNMKLLLDAGADTIVAGTAFFKNPELLISKIGD